MTASSGALDVTQASFSPKISIIIPTYNEESTLEWVIKEIDSLNLDITKVIVADLGSVDGTIPLAKELGASVIEEIEFSGRKALGRALIDAFRAVPNDTDIVVLIDADGMLPASKIPELIKPITDGRADVVLGSTYQSSSPMVKIGMKLSSLLASILGYLYITDPFTFLRAYSINALKTFELEKTKELEFPQLIIYTAKGKLRIEEIPVTRRLRYVRYERSRIRNYLRFFKEVLLRWNKF